MVTVLDVPKLPRNILAELEWLEAARSDPSVSEETWRTRGNALLERAGTLTPAQLAEFEALFSAWRQREADEEGTQWLREELAKHAPLKVGGDQVSERYQVGSIAVTVPALGPHLTLPARRAVLRRRSADLTGTCACGACAQVVSGVYRIEHAPECEARDESLRALLAGQVPPEG